MRTLLLITAAVFALSACTPARQDSSLQRSYSLLFSSDTVGTLQWQQNRHATIVETRETFKIKIGFKGEKNRYATVEEIHRETTNGKPLSFSRRITTKNRNEVQEGYIHNDMLLVKTENHLGIQEIKLTLPSDFLLTEGVRKRQKVARSDIKKISYSSWDYRIQNFVKVNSTWNPTDKGWHFLTKIADRPEQEYWTDPDFYLLERSLELLNKTLRIQYCHQSCPTGLTALQPLDHLWLKSPARIPDQLLHERLRFEISGLDRLGLQLPITAEQSNIEKEGRSIVEVCANCGKMPAPTQNDLIQLTQSNSWLRSDVPALRKQAIALTKYKATDTEKLRALEKFVHLRLSKNPGFDVYMDAWSAYKKKGGDCTESALLLTAMARAINIPAYMVVGLDYSSQPFHGRKHVFIPHAWTLAWVDGHWQSFDASLGFDHANIALALGNGEPEVFATVTKTINKISIESAVHLQSAAH